ncbi:TPA: DUF104 domain-containing protein [Candidatus Woesearchaeota archaeon]|nr:DUF104 domain-containing protein [Candidatus Woesearchaeota archaeon]HIG93964.1 DUF104 domain-containing protein [Candidatus Woesearchaeota archaeon]HIH12177.1 DUF104 domain-containing protein [Candidatus Woesearchaeota archaeon]
MSIEIEGIWKDGKIIPLDELELEEDTKVFITIPAIVGEKISLPKLAGAWKDYRTKDGKNLEDLKKEIFESRKITLRREHHL